MESGLAARCAAQRDDRCIVESARPRHHERNLKGQKRPIATLPGHDTSRMTDAHQPIE